MKDKERLENLNMALESQMELLENAKKREDYMSMSEHAANIQKLSYTIAYLKMNQ